MGSLNNGGDNVPNRHSTNETSSAKNGVHMFEFLPNIPHKNVQTTQTIWPSPQNDDMALWIKIIPT